MKLLAPNGQPSNLNPEQYKLVRTKAFKAWFGDWENDPENASKVIDENGEPLVVYHGTKKIFTKFYEKKYLGSEYDALNFFTTNYSTALKDYDGWITYPCFIKITKPLKQLTGVPESVIGKEVLQGLKTDGFIFSNGQAVQKPLPNYENWIAVPKSNQIKLAGNPIIKSTLKNKKFIDKANTTFEGTNTTFDGNNPDIRYKKGGYIGSCVDVGSGKKEVCRYFPNASVLAQYVGNPDEDDWGKSKETSPSQFYKYVSENDIPKKSVKGEHSFHYIAEDSTGKEMSIDETAIFFIYNATDDIHYFFKKTKFKSGGYLRLAKTPAPKSERIYGSKKNKPKSAESTRKGSSIILNPKTISSIKTILEKHNDKFPSKKIPLSTAKAVVRRGMGAYSATHRPTISGGKPNSRVAWGLARLNAFVYKIQKGKSKSGKYSQDNDLIKELGYRVAKFNEGGQMSNYQYLIINKNGNPVFRTRTSTMDEASKDLYDAIDRLFDMGYRINQVDISEYENFDASSVNPEDVREFLSNWNHYESGGSVMAKGGQLTDEQKEDYKKWKDLVNMSSSELKRFLESEEGKEAGLTKGEANKLGIHYGRESAKWILKMKDTPVKEWTPTMWEWCNRQISFISRMRGNKGGLYDDKGRKTRKHTSLLVWGHNPEKYKEGGCLCEEKYEHGGCTCGNMTTYQIEQALGRNLRWDETFVSVNGIVYKKVFLKPEYEKC